MQLPRDCARLREIARDCIQMQSDALGFIIEHDAHNALCHVSEFHGVGRLQSRDPPLVAPCYQGP